MVAKVVKTQQNVANPWYTLADRLKWAISQQPRDGRRRGLRLFTMRMEERARERKLENLGVQLSSIQKYLKGDGEPSRRFLVEAAHVLRVRESWLICNEGEPTAAAELARLAALRDTHEMGFPEPAEEVFRARLPWEWIGLAGRAQVWNLFTALLNRDSVGPDPKFLPPNWIAEYAEKASSAIMAGLNAIDAKLPRGSWVPEAYVSNVCAGLCTLIYATLDRERLTLESEV